MKKTILLLMTLCLMFVMSACGSSEKSSTTGGKAGKDLLAQIKKEGTIDIGIEGAYPPFNYFDDKNELVGFDVDVAKEITKRMGVKANFVATPWDTIIGGLLTKKYDIIISSMAITDERKEKVDFTDPYYHTGAQLFVREDYTEIKDPKTDAKGKNIGVCIGTTFEEKANELGAMVTTYKSDLLTFQDLSAKRIDAVITDKAVGSRVIKEQNYPFKSVGDMLFTEEAGITLNKNQEELKAEINKHLKAMMEDGTYAEISKKWFGEDIR
ncbi:MULTISPECIES: ABC transporter substrate-binding protein [unclassified Bacillus (in: firmicutes)]|uniref:ABC transporter substrate-binding protein n=1 Tax=unclassified Bacillus (in: firmicutes) TaxID=185979 RepID=UPI0008EFEC09|nr:MULTISPECIES: ABC transporter substrate-binding protein [unclassified Bacillus (in: firmicutes)]SFA69740.1 amino acid ABC transporter substrate-binding protein, PAAT family [Bacillus sp. UNCCL13]SFQ59084.1 amino acid ABC transporter substrate-binding protein, PAAT family [Bacillus sp. cl95]